MVVRPTSATMRAPPRAADAAANGPVSLSKASPKASTPAHAKMPQAGGRGEQISTRIVWLVERLGDKRLSNEIHGSGR
jgi:hypothetical protein